MKMEDWAKEFDVDKTMELIQRIGPILAGNPSIIQGTVLAELTAVWVMGHYADDEKTTANLRERLLDIQRDTIAHLMKH
jgi:hypothetical protein